MPLEQALIDWGIPALLSLIALIIVLPSVVNYLRRSQQNRRILGLGRAVQRRVWMDDGMDGKTFIDYLLLTDDGILLVNRNQREGIIFAGERMDSWAQVIGRKTYHFPNPLHELEALVAALRQQYTGIPIDYRLVFTNRCSFPKGKPATIERLSDIPKPDEEKQQPPPAPALAEAWEQLQSSVEPVSSDSEAALVEDKPAYRLRLTTSLLLLAVALSWVLYSQQLLG